MADLKEVQVRGACVQPFILFSFFGVLLTLFVPRISRELRPKRPSDIWMRPMGR
jgi:hypothetical protein